MGAFEYRQAEEIRDVFARHGVRYLFTGKEASGRAKDLESLPRLRSFREYWLRQHGRS
ncbi:MAG TPA: hypothetical protein VGS07_12475 [Thermoanaerobaculia bacterium]|jgi:hypothetical protein|nr:hypothetical protein [Thermoanaerobaculia bacterium]